MTNMMLPVGPASSRARMDLYTHIQLAGALTNLRLCLDAGDEASYTSGQVWTDLSASGANFDRGASTSSESSDPTFNGTVGRRSSGEYWSFDGGDYFESSASQPSWMAEATKNGSRNTLLSTHYMPSSAGSNGRLIQNSGTAFGDGGMNAFISDVDGAIYYNIENAGQDGFWVGSATSGILDSPIVVAISSEIEAEGARAIARARGQSLELVDSSISSTETPSSITSTEAFRIGRSGIGNNNPSGVRQYNMAFWDVMLPVQHIGAIVNSFRGKFSY